LLSILDGSSPETKSSQLLSDNLKRITYAEPNEVSQAPEGVGRVIWSGGGGVSSYAAQWAGATIRLDQAHTVSTGLGITVAVIDTGVDMTHPALAGRLVPGYDFVDQDNDPSEVGTAGVTPMYGHGTHVAGLVALAAPGAMIMPIRALDPFGKGDTWVVAKALAFAVDPDGNPNTNDGADVINLSMSTTTQSSLLRDVIRAVTCVNSDGGQGNLPCFQPGGRGAVVVAAAGNHSSSTLEYPAGDNLPALISVGATNESDLLATFSNYGSWVKVGAPGDTIMSSVPGGGYGAWSGTSMATPLTSGEVALVLSAFPSMTGFQAAQQVFGAATIIGGQVSHRIDAASAVGIPH
jgi:subtilisin family serine protease